MAAIAVVWLAGALLQLRSRKRYLASRPGELDALSTAHVALYYGSPSPSGRSPRSYASDSDRG